MPEPTEPPESGPWETGPRGRISVHLGEWTPPDQYDRPQLEPTTETRTKEHEVLGDKTVVQKIGEGAQKFTLRGDAFVSDIYNLRYKTGEVHEIQHPVFIGDVLVRSVRANSTGGWEDEGWVYAYQVDLIEVTE